MANLTNRRTIVLAGIAAAVIGAITVIAVLLIASGSDDRSSLLPPNDTVGPSGTPVPTASPSPIPTLPAQVPVNMRDSQRTMLTLGEDATIPPDVSILTLMGCPDCLDPAYGIGRTYIDTSGKARFEPLLWTKASALGIPGPQNSLGLPDKPGNFYTLHGVSADSSGNEIVAGVCCLPDGNTHVFRSTDAGVTWADYATLPGENAFVAELIAPGKILVGGGAYSAEPPFEYVPDGGLLTYPPGAIDNSLPFLFNGKLVYPTVEGGKLISESGVTYTVIDPVGYANFFPAVIGGKANDLGAMFEYQGKDPPTDGSCCAPGADSYIALFDPSDWHTTRAYYISGLFSAYPVAWLDDNHVFLMAPKPPVRTTGNIYETWSVPAYAPALAILEVSSDKVSFVDGPFSSDLPLRSVLAVQRGPFVKVKGAEGSCLNIRAQPFTDAQVLGCVADGVFLYDSLHGDKLVAATPIDGWVEVTTLGGVHGYAAAEFLEAVR